MKSPSVPVADPRKRRLILLTIAAGTFVSVLDQTGVTLALPIMASEFGATIPYVQWVAFGYILATGSLLLPAGSLSDMIGRKIVYVSGFAVFIVGAALAGLSSELMAVIAFRFVQGAGAAMIQANGMAILTTTFPARDRGRVIGLFMTMVGMGAIMGPIVSGFVVGTFGWRDVFLIGVPLGLISITAASIVLIRDTPRVRGLKSLSTGFDWIGAFLSASGLVVFLLVMTTAYRVGWTSPLVIGGLALSVGLLTAFVYWERFAAMPMLDLELFRRKIFALGVSASFFGFLAGNGVFSMMPFYLQGVLDLSPRLVGLIITPAAIGFAISGPLSGPLSDRFGPRRVEFVGLGMMIASLLFLGQLTTETAPWNVAVAMSMQGLGMGIFYTPNTSSVLSVVERERYGVATAFLNMTRNTASVAGVGMVTSIVTFAMAYRGFEPSLDAVAAGGADVAAAFTMGLRVAFLTLGSFNLVPVVLTILKPSVSLETDDELSASEGSTDIKTDIKAEAQPGGDS
ncbi:MAG: MFS transporter [Dehalococcoidia bacterium]|nr:MFS transporter [Dehalococcoidia bacterium]